MVEMGLLQMLFFYSKSGNRFISPKMVHYCENYEVCRRELLFSDFDGCLIEKPCSFCFCCNVCGQICDCKTNDCLAFSHVRM